MSSRAHAPRTPVTPAAPVLTPPPLARFLLVASIEAFSQVLFWRGTYFFVKSVLGFTAAENLGMGLGAGLGYVVGASMSHHLTRRFDEKRLLVAVFSVQATLYVVCGVLRTGPVIVPAFMALGLVQSMKWPVLQSYTSAGRVPAATAQAVGKYNLVTAAALWPAMVLAGPMIELWEPLLFGVAALCSVANLLVVGPMARRPVHLPHDHPERPKPDELPRLGAMLWAARWSLMSSFALLGILSALMPIVYDRLGYGVALATPLASLLDAMRFGAFLLMALWAGWHGRASLVAAGAIALPAGFFLVLFGPVLPAVLLGEALFGFGAGVAYFAALYYAMVIKNASVDAGGGHERLIGAGIAIGPATALVADLVGPFVGGEIPGTLIGVGPLILLTLGLSLRSLTRLRRTDGKDA